MSLFKEAKELLGSGKLKDMIANAEEYKKVIIKMADIVTETNTLIKFLVKLKLDKPQKTAFETMMKELENE